MFEELRLENFKAIGVGQSIPLRPITLIFGANNSGKSSILQSLLLLKQTLEAGDTATALLSRGNLTDLHSLAMLQHRPSLPDQRVVVALRMSGSIGRLMNRDNAGYGIPTVPDDACPSPWLSFSFSGDQRTNVRLDTYTIGTEAWDNELARFANLTLSGDIGPRSHRRTRDLSDGRWLGLSRLSSEHPAMLLAWQRFEVTRANFTDARSGDWHKRGEKASRSYHRVFTRNDVAPLLMSLDYPAFVAMMKDAYSEPVRALNFLLFGQTPFDPIGRAQPEQEHPLKVMGLLDVFGLCQGLSRRLAIALRSKVVYAGLRRFGEDRYHIYSGSRREEVGVSGQHAADMLFADPSALARVNEWLAHFGIGADMVVHSLDDGESSSAFSLELVDTSSGVRVQLPDTGSGLRQLLPVVLQAIAARGKLLLIEEPESHLHPRLQAQLGDLFAESATKHHNQFLIETHSEHLVLRIQSLVRRGILGPENVSILFVRRARTGARVETLRLDREGDFMDEWPEGFFPERLAEFL